MRVRSDSGLCFVLLTSATLTALAAACSGDDSGGADGGAGRDGGVAMDGAGGSDGASVDAAPEDAAVADAALDAPTGDGGPSFAAPDILDNASFETGWDGFMNGGGGDPAGPARSTTVAYDGTYAAEFSFTSSTSDQSYQMFYDMGAGRTKVYVRTWFYLTAIPNGPGWKFFRAQDDGYDATLGIQTQDGQLAFDYGDPSELDVAIIGSGFAPTLDTWHSLEFLWDETVTPTVIRIWYDGVLQTGSVYYGTSFNYVGTDLQWTGPAFTPRHIDLNRVINPCTNSGSIFFDRIAASTMPIGP